MSSPTAWTLAILLGAAQGSVALVGAATADPQPSVDAGGRVGPAAASAPSLPVELDVHATGFDDDVGHAVAMLFRPSDNVLDQRKAYRRVTAPIHAREARLTFTDLPEGAYALILFHDENDNGQVDHNLLRLPKEQLGFSRGFRPGLLAGMPSFEKLKFQVSRTGDIRKAALAIVVR